MTSITLIKLKKVSFLVYLLPYNKHVMFLCLNAFYCLIQICVGRIAQPVTGLSADPGIASAITTFSHAFVEIDDEIILQPFSSFR